MKVDAGICHEARMIVDPCQVHYHPQEQNFQTVQSASRQMTADQQISLNHLHDAMNCPQDLAARGLLGVLWSLPIHEMLCMLLT